MNIFRVNGIEEELKDDYGFDFSEQRQLLPKVDLLSMKNSQDNVISIQ